MPNPAAGSCAAYSPAAASPAACSCAAALSGKADCPFRPADCFEVLELHDDGHFEFTILGSDLEAGHRPQYTVPPNTWFGSFPTLDISSYSTDGSVLAKAPSRDPDLHYSLVGCTCAPAFQFEDFEFATLADMLALAPKAGPLLEHLVQPN